MRRAFVLMIAVAAGIYACSEATDGLVGYDVIYTLPEAGADGAPGTTTTSSSGGSSGKTVIVLDAASVSEGVILLNELSPSAEWVEIINSGGTAVDMSGWQITDRDKTTGGPKAKDLVSFPQGTSLAPNAYALVQGGDDAAAPCPGDGTAVCLHATFGISNKNGETIFLLQPDASVVGTAVYPPDAANGDGISWGRIPNGDPNGVFELTPASPGADNPSAQ